MRGLSLCSGVGMLDLAAEWAGIEVAGMVEIDPYCQEVLAHQRPGVPLMGDIKEVIGNEFGTIDILYGGIPCQPFSKSGKQRGTADDRHLWPEALRLITRADPTWVVIENVAHFLPMVLDSVQPDLENAGYEVQAFVLPACAVDAPHIRERACIVAHANGTRFNAGEHGSGDKTSYSIAHHDSKTMAHTMHQRCERHTQAGWQTERRPEYPSDNAEADRTVMGNPNGARWAGSQPSPRNRKATGLAWRSAEDRIARLSQSSLGGMLDGATARIHRSTRWPSLQGEEQAAWEPPRVVSQRVPNHARRLKAIGNGAVPQLFYRVFAGIMLIESGMGA